LDVRCRDRAGTTFVVEMQLLHVAASRIARSTTPAKPTQISSR
jgi:hypothetical protein